MGLHLLAHQFAKLLALFLAQVQLLEHAVAAVVVARATVLHGHGEGQGRQGGSEQQGGEGLTHGDSPCLENLFYDLAS